MNSGESRRSRAGPTWDSEDGPTEERAPVPPVTSEASGRYQRDEEELGRGGIGRVLVATDTHLGRQIAVKELLPSSTATARFLLEARVTAQLEHPNIVPVYELGRRADGTLYYTMKRVRGRTLSDALAGCVTLEERLRLLGHFVSMCHAVAYAHSRGVVHRDLKPHNVMVGEFGETVLLDWGLAKVRGQHDHRGGDLEAEVHALREGDTAPGATLGTPAYMSPEQALGHIDRIDERSDVWSLGAVLYEILSGVPPFTGRTPLDTLAQVIHETPPLAEGAPPELANVCEKALQRDPSRRYQTARELAEEIVAWQAGGRVSAHAYTPGELAWKYVARHRGSVLVAAMALVVIVVLTAVFAVRIVAERDRARDAEQATASQLGRALTERAVAAWRDGDAAEAWVLAAGALRLGETPEARGALIAAQSGWLPRLRTTLDLHERCRHVAYSPDGRWIVTATRTGAWRWSSSGSSKLDMRADAALGVAWVGEDVVTALATGTLLRWPGATGESVRIGREEEGIRALAARPGTREVATGGYSGGVRVWNLDDPSRDRQAPRHGRGVMALAWSSDGRLLASAGLDQRIRVWDGAGSLVIEEGALSLAFSPDTRVLATAGDAFGGDGRIRLWDPGTGEPLGSLVGHGGEVMGVAFSPDGRLLASAATDGTVRIWDVHERVPLARLSTHEAAARGVSFSPDGRRLAAVAGEGRALEWELPVRPGRLVGHDRAVFAAEFLDEDRLVSVGDDRRVVTWDLQTGRAERDVATPPLARAAALLSNAVVLGTDPDGLRVLLAGGSTIEWRTGALVADIAVRGSHAALALGRRIQVRDLLDGELLWESEMLDATIIGLAWRADGIVASFSDGTVRRYDATGRELARSTASSGALGEVAIAPDGRRLVAGERSGALRALEVPSMRDAWRARGHRDAAIVAAFSPDGRIVASGGWDGDVRIWDATSGRALAVIPAHSNILHAVSFSPSGEQVASASADRRTAIWRLDGLSTPADALADAARMRFGLVLEGADTRLR